ncbi:hydrolase [Plectosphaerella plurivora]|uniref:Hydrolase n=1 Tax=Plectosphaerella plurivora TaxID=936078 RepID=A0A9P8V749_9PEZI|nr:hydrolase [Plectosphaerella plurivora]
MDDINSVPPIPQRMHRHTPQHYQTSGPSGASSSNTNTSSSRRRSNRAPDDIPPNSPEVISSLITSLSIVSKPASRHFDGPSLSLPASPSPSRRSPSPGSFGVDYGAFSKPSLDDLREETQSLDDLAASAPVIRTAKPPSGFSPLTAPKSPREPSTSFKSILRNSSRPSSKGSLGSRDDAQSIGNLSIERGTAPASVVETSRSRSRSRDSWGRKQLRNHKGLMYMTSKEQLREQDQEKKRSSTGNLSVDDRAALASPRPDPFLAETPISEEPPHLHSNERLATEDSTAAPAHPILDRRSMESVTSPRPIPERDSSLRSKTGQSAKRSSARSSRTKRDSDGKKDVIIEGDEPSASRSGQRRSRQQVREGKEAETSRQSADYLGPETRSSITLNTPSRSYHGHHQTVSRETGMMSPSPTPHDDLEDGAPFPAVSQGRRRDERSSDRHRMSGRQTPGAGDTIRLKRSSSRLKRLSAPLSPRSDEGQGQGGSRSRVASPEATMPTGYERPQSADSVDDAVESYLCSPRLSQKIKHPQTGRVISFSEVGDSEGSAVFCCVGMGLTRYITAFYDELALTLKLRLITPDRPGVGDSESYSDGTATPLSWPDDVYAICQALKITKFSILAHSAGAIYALATALRMPQHIRGRIHLLAPWIPPSQMNVFGTSQNLPPTNAIPTSQRILRALPTPFLKAANSSFMSATSSSITSSLPKTPRRKRKSATPSTGRDTPAIKRDPVPSLDKENLGVPGQGKDADAVDLDLGSPENMDRIRPGGGIGSDAILLAAATDAMADKERQMTYDTRLTHAIWDLATTGANPAVDLLVCLERRHTIGFRYVDITRPVVIHHGSRDTRVPVENVKWLGKTMRRCEVRVLEGEGHGLMASAGVMGSVLMEISKEWEDWMKVTGHGKKEERGRRGTLGGVLRLDVSRCTHCLFRL